MKKKTALFLCLILLISTIGTGCSSKKDAIRFGAADIGGIYYTFANAYAGLVNNDAPDYSIEVKKTAGSAANLRLLADGYIDLCIAQNDMIDDAVNGTGTFAGKSISGYSAIASLYPEACQIIVKKDSNIKSLDDLTGKTISIGASDSGTERNAKQILEVAGLNNDLVKTTNLDYIDAAESLVSGEIDAFFVTAGIQTTVIEELTRTCDIRLIGLNDSCKNKLLSAYSYYSDFTIPANTYSGQTEDVSTVCVQAVMLADNDLSKDTVEDLTRLLFEHANDLQYSLSIDMQLNEQTATKGITIPFHKGAAAYYKEKGITVDVR